MVSFRSLFAAGLAVTSAFAKPVQHLDFTGTSLARRATPLAGYLGYFFRGDDKSNVYMYISDGNDPASFRPALKDDAALLTPTLGTKAVRDPYIVDGGGKDKGKKYFILGTDLNIKETSWDKAQRQGSRSILVWESEDLVTWGKERLVEVETNPTAGMVWAPEALYDQRERKYFVHWASKFYGKDDAEHTGQPGPTMIRYTYTSDFVEFEPPKTYIDMNTTDVIDLTILAGDNNGERFLRFIKDESLKNVFVEASTDGLQGPWLRHPSSDAFIEKDVEGPAAFWDNLDEEKVHLLLDHYGAGGYQLYESKNPASNLGWNKTSTDKFPTGLRHGSVLPIDEATYATVKGKFLSS
ncbi:hypothetical protein CTA2_11306 [Colletotrichum tanaceti]|uniref:Arabinosidase n=1 Tax=Colletotrichum tanaceti TaxID=1306861 RepID=A0A4U6X304_9PEZI|nr:hypothetical protein CTA2_11306 [Colletotrichum tanaceti]TKW49384.1 hypothetical protein CTA1_11210 [Colletotrichum tanaceti]